MVLWSTGRITCDTLHVGRSNMPPYAAAERIDTTSSRRMVIAVRSCERDNTIDGRVRKIWRDFSSTRLRASR